MSVIKLLRDARCIIGGPQYRFRREDCVGLRRVNCFSFLTELWRMQGRLLPDDFELLLHAGSVVHFSYEPGTVLLSRAAWGGYCVPRRRLWYVGHVSLITEARTVIHASHEAGTVVEAPLHRVLPDWSWYCGTLSF